MVDGLCFRILPASDPARQPILTGVMEPDSAGTRVVLRFYMRSWFLLIPLPVLPMIICFMLWGDPLFSPFGWWAPVAYLAFAIFCIFAARFDFYLQVPRIKRLLIAALGVPGEGIDLE